MPATEAYHSPDRFQKAEPVVSTPPVLLAALPDSVSQNEPKHSYLLPPSAAGTAIPPVQQPDTTLKQATPPVVIGRADPATTVVNVIGGAATAVGLGIIIANSGEAPQTEWGGLGQTIGLLLGIVMALLGFALLFFQGKNGRLRRLHEARIAAAGANSLPPGQSLEVVPEPAKLSAPTSHKHKTGFRLMIAGGVAGLLGFTVSVFLLPIAVILLLIGAVFSITGH